MSTRIFLDIETAPVSETDPAWQAWLAAQHDAVKAPGNIKDPEKIAAAVAEKRAALAGQRTETTLDPMLGSVVVVGVAVNDGPVEVFAGLNERDLLADLEDYLSTPFVTKGPHTFVGHNIAGFDAPWLQMRAYRHGMRRLAHRFGTPGGKPWERPLEDTRDLWPSFKVGLDVVRGINGASLPSLCRFLGLGIPDDDITGAEVAEALASGDVASVEEHCRRDVERVRAVYAAVTGWTP